MENQHQMIEGYRNLSEREIQIINEIKKLEATVGQSWKEAQKYLGNIDLDMRWMNIAKTHFEEGFSAFVRAVAKAKPQF